MHNQFVFVLCILKFNMAFTGIQKQKIRKFLGISPFFKMANSTLESALDLVGSTYPEAEAQIVSDIALLESIDLERATVSTAAIAAETEGTKTNCATATALLEKRGRSVIADIATALGMNVIGHDYYSAVKCDSRNVASRTNWR